MSSDSPSGPYRVVTTVETQNLVQFKTDGWQAFKFDRAVGRYLKVRLLSTFGSTAKGSIVVFHELRVMGELR